MKKSQKIYKHIEKKSIKVKAEDKAATRLSGNQTFAEQRPELQLNANNIRASGRKCLPCLVLVLLANPPCHCHCPFPCLAWPGLALWNFIPPPLNWVSIDFWPATCHNYRCQRWIRWHPNGCLKQKNKMGNKNGKVH